MGNVYQAMDTKLGRSVAIRLYGGAEESVRTMQSGQGSSKRPSLLRCLRAVACHHLPNTVLALERIRREDRPGVVLTLDQRIVSALVGRNRDIAVNTNFQLADTLALRPVVFLF